MDPINETPPQQYRPPIAPTTPQTPVLKRPGTPFLALAVSVVIGLGVLAYLLVRPTKSPTPTPTPTSAQSASPSPTASLDLNTKFNLAQKTAGTKLYYSDILGVGFTYNPGGPNSNNAYTYFTKISETGNIIHVETWDTQKKLGENSVEIFSKDPALTLIQAVTSRFLAGYDPKKCWVVSEPRKQGSANYVAATITFPGGGMDDLILAKAQCPAAAKYMELGYFAMNPDIPNKFFFVQLGQDAPVDDGTPGGQFGWDHSIQVLK